MSSVVNISAQIPAALAKKLEKISAFEGRSKSYYIKKSLEKFFEEKLEDILDLIDGKAAQKEFIKSGRKTIPFEKVFKKAMKKKVKKSKSNYPLSRSKTRCDYPPLEGGSKSAAIRGGVKKL